MALTIRLKILALSAALLGILCAALFVSLRLQESVHEEVAAITEYHIPLSNLIAELDVQTFEYELNLFRMLRADQETAAIQKAEARERELIAGINANFDRLEELTARAVGDERNDLSDRLVFSRLLGMSSLLRREAAPFEEIGLAAIEARRQGRSEDVHRLLREFERFERVFGPDLASVRKEIEGLTLASTEETLGQQGKAESFSLAVFLGAAVFGLGCATLIATRMVGGLRRLLAGAEAAEHGTLAEPLPITTRDEVGQLTRAFNHMVQELRAKEKIRDTFGKYVDPKIVASLIDVTGDGMDRAERRVVTVFFSDIKGFSSLSEQMTASVIATFLNRWFTLATDAIRARNGVVDKYIGDAVMAFWAPPFSPGDDHAADACLAALAQQQELEKLKRELPELLGLRRQVPDLVVRMGLATGEVVVGTIGSPTARSYTVIGDTVNLASRLESINKVYGTRVIIAEDTYKLAHAAIEAREIDLITVAGKTEPVRIYEVLAPAGGLSPEQEAARGRFAEGLSQYRARDWDAAEQAFKDVIAGIGDDAPSRLFLDRIARLRATPPPADWDGVTRHVEK